jgi:hypothetical protein
MLCLGNREPHAHIRDAQHKWHVRVRSRRLVTAAESVQAANDFSRADAGTLHLQCRVTHGSVAPQTCGWHSCSLHRTAHRPKHVKKAGQLRDANGERVLPG